MFSRILRFQRLRETILRTPLETYEFYAKVSLICYQLIPIGNNYSTVIWERLSQMFQICSIEFAWGKFRCVNLELVRGIKQSRWGKETRWKVEPLHCFEILLRRACFLFREYTLEAAEEIWLFGFVLKTVCFHCALLYTIWAFFLVFSDRCLLENYL